MRSRSDNDFDEYLKSRKLPHTNAFGCEFCERQFRTERGLRRHLQYCADASAEVCYMLVTGVSPVHADHTLISPESKARRTVLHNPSQGSLRGHDRLTNTSLGKPALAGQENVVTKSAHVRMEKAFDRTSLNLPDFYPAEN
jgi:hypothetical protein